MKIIIEPSKEQWKGLCARPQLELDFLESSVKNILMRVKKSGDNALQELTQLYDQVKLDKFAVPPSEIEAAKEQLSAELKSAIQVAAQNIEKFHAAQKIEPIKIETTTGVTCWRKGVPINRVGIYIPGGTAPLFSTVLMLAIPARLAGCPEIILCSPPDYAGKIHPAILFAAHLTGIEKIFKIGGAQAIAAMAFGTESIPQVYKIFGPGNQFVTKAKQLVSNEGTAIDMPAGPSEVLVLADQDAQPSFIAADLLSQAEHGEDSQVMLVTTDESMLEKIKQEIDRQLDSLPRKEIASKALLHSRAIYFKGKEDALQFVNTYAPEHLIIQTATADEDAKRISNAGSVFIGQYAAEAIGDYASGTNHTLPTNGSARAQGGISLDSFLKYITFQKISAEGLSRIGPVVEKMAEAEQLLAHKRAVTIRLNTLVKH
jgi:histidinol dehydrogenase